MRARLSLETPDPTGWYENGLPASTPAAAIARATRPDEEIVLATIGDLHTRLAATPLSGPVLVLIGRVLSNRVEAVTSNGDTEGGVNKARMDAAKFGRFRSDPVARSEHSAVGDILRAAFAHRG